MKTKTNIYILIIYNLYNINIYITKQRMHMQYAIQKGLFLLTQKKKKKKVKELELCFSFFYYNFLFFFSSSKKIY